MAALSIRVATMADAPAILALADRLPAFGPTTRAPAEIAARERAALGDALSRPSPGSGLLVAEQPPHGVVGVTSSASTSSSLHLRCLWPGGAFAECQSHPASVPADHGLKLTAPIGFVAVVRVAAWWHGGSH
jgi:hypothetical protein